MDFAQVKAEVLTGTADNSTKLGGKTLAEVLADAAAIPADNTAKFNGMTPEEYNQFLMSTMRQFICYQADIDYLDPNDNVTQIASYQPIGYNYVDTVDNTVGKESLHVVMIHSAIAGESPVTELRIRHQGTTCQWSTSSKTSAVQEVGYVITSEEETGATTPIYKVVLFVKLAAGARFLKSVRVSGYYYGFTVDPMLASPAAPNGYVLGTYTPALFGAGEMARTIYTGSLVSTASNTIAGIKLEDKVQVLVKDNLNPTDYYDAASSLTIKRTATGLTLTNETAEDLDYQVLVDSTETVTIVPIP